MMRSTIQSLPFQLVFPGYCHGDSCCLYYWDFDCRQCELSVRQLTFSLDDVLVGGDELDGRRQLTGAVGISGLDDLVTISLNFIFFVTCALETMLECLSLAIIFSLV